MGGGTGGGSGREGLVDQAGNLVLGDRPGDGSGANQPASGTSGGEATGEFPV